MVVYNLQKCCEESSWRIKLMEQDHISWVIPVKNFQEKQNSWKGGPVFPARKFQTQICVPIFKPYSGL